MKFEEYAKQCSEDSQIIISILKELKENHMKATPMYYSKFFKNEKNWMQKSKDIFKIMESMNLVKNKGKSPYYKYEITGESLIILQTFSNDISPRYDLDKDKP